MANELKQVFSSTTTTVISLTSDLTNNSVGGGTTLLDNSTELYPYAVATLLTRHTVNTGIDKTAVNLYAVLQDTDGSSDDTAAPASSDVESARFMGAFPIYDEAVDTDQRATITISLEGIKKAYFYIENKTGQTLDGDGGTAITVKITPFSMGPT
jgi:hypothetical protein